MVVLASGVSLPDFQHRIVDGRAVPIKHAKGDPCTLTLCIRAGNAPYAVLIGSQLDLEKGADRL